MEKSLKNNTFDDLIKKLNVSPKNIEHFRERIHPIFEKKEKERKEAIKKLKSQDYLDSMFKASIWSAFSSESWSVGLKYVSKNKDGEKKSTVAREWKIKHSFVLSELLQTLGKTSVQVCLTSSDVTNLGLTPNYDRNGSDQKRYFLIKDGTGPIQLIRMYYTISKNRAISSEDQHHLQREVIPYNKKVVCNADFAHELFLRDTLGWIDEIKSK